MPTFTLERPHTKGKKREIRASKASFFSLTMLSLDVRLFERIFIRSNAIRCLYRRGGEGI
jgi:hypothetical protein